MFKAVRDSLLGFGHRIGEAWQDLRSRGMIRLFLFEFAVVLLGVLAAQGLQGWAQQRSAEARLEGSVTRLNEAIGTNLFSAHAWAAAVPCLRDRLKDIMHHAGEQRDVPSEWLERPSISGTVPLPLTADDELLLRRVQGHEQASIFVDAEADRKSLDRGIQIVADRWVSLAVIDPKLGEVQPGDRTNARHDAAQMLSALRRIEIVSRSLIEWGEHNGFEPDSGDGRTIRNCEEMWTTGHMAPRTEAD